METNRRMSRIFLDYFEPVPGINFVPDDNTLKIDYFGYNWHPKFHPDKHPDIYDELKLKPFIKDIIMDKINKLEKKYISVHIRRTDHVNLAKRNRHYTDDNKFIKFMDKSKTDKNIYIATDNLETYDKFKKRYSDRVKFEYHEVNNDSFRKTSLLDAITDIFMCVYSDSFMGSGWSSFSDLIVNLRKIQKKDYDL